MGKIRRHFTTKHTHLKSVVNKKNKENCSLCGNKLENEYGNNPYPLLKKEEDRCCNLCNHNYVIPSRLCVLLNSQTKVLLNKKGCFKDIPSFIKEIDNSKHSQITSLIKTIKIV